MRVAILGARGIPAQWGGFEVFADELSTRLVRRGHDVTVYCRPRYSASNRPAEYRGVKLVYLSHLPGKLLESPSHEALSALHSLREPYDIYYVLGCRASWCYLPHRLAGKRLVFQTDGLDWRRRKWGVLARTYLRWSYWLALRIATRVASDSQAICDYFKARHGIYSEYLSVGGYVVDSAPVEVLATYGLRPGEYFLVVCRLEPENNIDLIIRAFEMLPTDKRLVIVGGANYASQYVKSLRSTKDARVVFTGPVYEPGHVEALCLHSFGYLDGHEVGGTSPGLLRAMGCGSCVLVLDEPFNAEVVGDAGILWQKSVEDLRSRMALLLDRPQEAARLRRLARARVATHYSWDAAVDAHERCFTGVIAGNRSDAGTELPSDIRA